MWLEKQRKIWFQGTGDVCYECDYEFTSKQGWKAHNEAVHEGVEY